MEQVGLKLDTARLAEVRERVMEEANRLEREIWADADEEFVIGSPKQLEEILFGKLGLSRKRRGKTGFSTDARVLQAIRDEHPIIPRIERFRELTKLAQTYLDALPLLLGDDGRLRTTFIQTAAATGRLSSINPNLQNIPIRTELGREVRACFVAEEGNVLVAADYEQVELRILANIAGEDVLKDIFKRGEDVHTATAATVFNVAARRRSTSACARRPRWSTTGSSTACRPTAWPTAWGSSRTRPRSSSTATWPASRPSARFITETIEQGTDQGYVSTLFGRRRMVPELRSRRWEMRKQGERFAVNMVIQGTAADIMKIAMVRAAKAVDAEGLQARMVLQIHDELLFEAPADEVETVQALARREMIAAHDMDPPLAVDVGSGPNWLAAK